MLYALCLLRFIARQRSG